MRETARRPPALVAAAIATRLPERVDESDGGHGVARASSTPRRPRRGAGRAGHVTSGSRRHRGSILSLRSISSAATTAFRRSRLAAAFPGASLVAEAAMREPTAWGRSRSERQVVDELEEAAAQGNVRRVVVAEGTLGRRVPLDGGGREALPRQLAAVGALVAVLADCSIGGAGRRDRPASGARPGRRLQLAADKPRAAGRSRARG
jgi:hypothetical protein